MKICQINCCYGTGSTGKIVEQVHKYILNNNHESIVCTSASIEEEGIFSYGNRLDKYISAILVRFTGNKYGYAIYQTCKLIKILEKENPDLIHIHCANAYDTNIYRLISWCNKHNKKIVLTEHAEYYYTGNCTHSFECDKWQTGCGKCPNKKRTFSLVFDCSHYHWEKQKKLFDNSNLTITSVSEWVMNRSLQSPITQNHKHYCIHNGVETTMFRIYNDIPQNIAKMFAKKTILHVTPDFNQSIKGGKFVIELAKLMPQYNFIIIGSGKVENVPSNMIFINHTTNKKELAMYYNLADVTLLTSKRETFSMVTAESLCCGTPVVGFEAGAPETIAIPEYSAFVEYGNISLLKDKLIEFLGKEFDKNEISRKGIEKYNSERMVEQYYKVYLECIKN